MPDAAATGENVIDKVADTVVILGVKGLGRVIAGHFARQGCTVICAGRSRETIEEVATAVDRAGGRGVPIACDLQDPATLETLVGSQPRLDLVIASQTSGGRFGSKPLLEIEHGELDRVFGAYVRGTWNLLKAVGPRLLAQKRGTFLQIGTSSGVRTREGWAPLGAAQHGLRALVQVAAREWRSQGVHAAYLPIDGAIASDRSAAWMASNGVDRAIPAEEIARACEYLHRQDPRAWTHELVLRPAGTEWSAPT